MLDSDNYVARLRALALAIGPGQRGTVESALAAGFGVPAGSIDFFRLLVAAMELANRARAQVVELSDNPSYDVYEAVISEIQSGFLQIELHSSWDRYAHLFRAENLAHLLTCELLVASRLTGREAAQRP